MTPVIQFIVGHPNHNHCARPIFDWLVEHGHLATWSLQADANLGPIVALDVPSFFRAGRDIIKRMVWIDHGLAGHIKRNVPIDPQASILLNLFESTWAREQSLLNMRTFCVVVNPGGSGLIHRNGRTLWEGKNTKVVGFPKNDYLFKHLKQSSGWEMPNVPIILYAPSAGEGDAIGGNRDEVGLRVIEIAKDFGTVIVKAHPNGKPFEVPGVINVDPTWNITPLLTEADILITGCSSTMLEYAVLGRPIIQVVDGLPSHLRTDVGIACTIDHLGENIQRSIDRPGEFWRNREAWVSRTNYTLDDKAAERAALAILEVA